MWSEAHKMIALYVRHRFYDWQNSLLRDDVVEYSHTNVDAITTDRPGPNRLGGGFGCYLPRTPEGPAEASGQGLRSAWLGRPRRGGAVESRNIQFTLLTDDPGTAL